MKHPPIRFCDECAFAKFGWTHESIACDKGHKPRFYRPKLIFADQDWGYKRRCADFQKASR
jgi:hypothetical protein